MGYDELLLVGGIGLMLFILRQITKLNEAMSDVAEEERRLHLHHVAPRLCLGSVVLVAILFVLRHAFLRH